MEIKNTNKKIYSKPELEVVKVDHEISLVMQTSLGGDDPDAGGGPEGSAGLNEGGMSSPVTTYKSAEENNPFGDSSPFEN